MLHQIKKKTHGVRRFFVDRLVCKVRALKATCVHDNRTFCPSPAPLQPPSSAPLPPYLIWAQAQIQELPNAPSALPPILGRNVEVTGSSGQWEDGPRG